MVLIPNKLPPPITPLERIAFAGPMCSGKTTLANILVSDYGYTKISFADKLKEIAVKLYGPIEKNNQGRKLLQELADDLKKWDPNLFTTHFLRAVEGYLYDYDNQPVRIVVDDLRFFHEFQLLKANGFTVVGVLCDEPVRLTRIFSLYPDTDPARFEHPSEQGWKEMKMDYWINNNGIGGPLELQAIVGGINNEAHNKKA